MSFKFSIRITGLFLCLFAVLAINTPAVARDEDKNTSSALCHYIMGVVYDDLGDIDKAIQEYQKVLKLDSNSALIHLKLAAAYIRNNNLDKAVEELNLASRLDPEAVQPHALLALVYSSQKKMDLAAHEYELALKNASKLAPSNIDIYKTLGFMYLQEKRFKEAEETYILILGLAPADAQAHFYLANVYGELKNRAKAKTHLKKSLELKPDYHQALNYLGYIYVEENENLDAAEILIKKALEIEPDNAAYIDSLGWFYFKKGKLKESLQQLKRAGSLLEDPVVYDHLAQAYLKLGDDENARLNWQKSLALDPGQDQIKNKIEALNRAIQK